MQLNTHFQSEFTKLLEKYNGFYAFGKEQFDEAAKPELKYISLDGWLLLGRPKDSELTGQEYADKFFEEYERILAASVKFDLEEYGLERIIRYELDNHETNYTGDIGPAFEALEKYGATREQVMSVFRGLFI